VAGIAFSVLLTVALALVRTAIPADPEDAREWLSDGSRRDALLLALGLVPFAGIAFPGSGFLFVVVHVLFAGFRRDAGPSHTELAARHGV
jgi:hypothetical protein